MIRKRTWPQCDDALRNTSADLICVNIILSMAICGNLFCGALHYLWCLQSSMKDLEEEPALQCRRQSARRTRCHLSLVQGLLRESWIRGCLGSRTIPSPDS